LYVPFQDSTFVPVTFNGGAYTNDKITLPRLDAIAARDKSGKLWLEITNLDPNQSVEVSVAGVLARSGKGEILTAPKLDSVNTFESPNAVVPKPLLATVQDGKLTLKLEPKSVSVISFEQ
jgi:alpha-N-arabinofuranosidase